VALTVDAAHDGEATCSRASSWRGARACAQLARAHRNARLDRSPRTTGSRRRSIRGDGRSSSR